MQIVTTHKNCDFDGLASVIAVTLLYPGTIAIIPKSVNPNVKSFLSMHKDVFDIRTATDIDLTAVTRLFVVDVARWDRLDGLMPLREREDIAVRIWDHHPGQGDMDAADICQVPIGACITLLVRELQARRILLTPVQATLFITGLYEDTGRLTFPSTTAEDARAAAYLLEQDADLAIVGRILRPFYGEKQKDILHALLEKCRRLKVNGYTIGIGRIDIRGHVDSLALVVRLIRELLNVDAAIGLFFHPEKDQCMVIGRSVREELNIGSLMRHLGGGGHPGAGSALMKGVQPQAIQEMILGLIKGHQQSSVRVSDLMSFPVVSVQSTTPMSEVARLLREKGCTGLPVIDDGKLRGVISRRDFKRVRKKRQLGAPVKAFMKDRVLTITPDKSPGQAVGLMIKHDIGRLPVVENDTVIGIVTRSDAMLYFYDLLPE
jgi:nanoRNase/pAp phosphatase (c-di-AMP/oligoRNAs hydrolase)/CBS domain-containing protein